MFCGCYFSLWSVGPFSRENKWVISFNQEIYISFFSEGFSDENSKWLTPAKRKRKIDEPESEDDSDEHWEQEEDDEEEEEQQQQQAQQKKKKGEIDQGKKGAKLGMKEVEEGEEEEDDDDDDDDEEMVDDYGTLDDGSGEEEAEEESDGDEVSEILLPTFNYLTFFYPIMTVVCFLYLKRNSCQIAT